MKSLNYLLIAAAVATMANVAPATQAGERHPWAKLTPNKAILHSPRYLEEHPELLRATQDEQSSARKTHSLANLNRNSALANSPRFREEHPELLWTNPSPGRTTASEQELTENKALVNSPRFREQRPELLRGGPAVEIAPLK